MPRKKANDTSSALNSVHQIKITLDDIRPPIWRRVLVPSDITLERLHTVIQAAMGWTDSHLHAFRVGRISYGVPDEDLGLQDESRYTLARIAAAPKAKFDYEYDFGDSWGHTILVENVLSPEPGATYPVCIKGARACPPEDCGGVGGYYELLEVLKNPKHKDYKDLLEWLGEDFDPEALELDEINQQLAAIKKSRRTSKRLPTLLEETEEEDELTDAEMMSALSGLLGSDLSGPMDGLMPFPLMNLGDREEASAPPQPPYTAPTREEWANLYKAAVAFRDVSPWIILTEDDLFAVRNPENGEIGYCCVLGKAGQLTALNLYRGSQGLQGHWRIKALGDPEMMEGDPTEAIRLQDCLQASFVNREELLEEEYQLIKDLGMRFRGKGAWPQIVSYMPGFLPWKLSGEEARFLTIALEQTIEVMRAVINDQEHLVPAAPEGSYLVRVLKEGGWQDQWERAERYVPELPTPAPIDKPALDELRNQLTKNNGILEVDSFYLPMPIGEPGQRPYMPQVAMIAERRSGMIMDFQFTESAALPELLPKKILEVIEKAKLLPGRVLVQREEIFLCLEPMLAHLGIELLLVGELSAIESAKSSFYGLAMNEMGGFDE